MLSTPLVLAASFAYLLLLFARRALRPTAARRQGRSLIGNAWVYTLSIGVYCTAWTYFGSVGRAATSGLWFLPIYLGPTLGDAAGLDGAAQDDPHRAHATASPRSPTSSPAATARAARWPRW